MSYKLTRRRRKVISTSFLDRPERTQRIFSLAFRYVIDWLSRLQSRT